MRGGVFHIFWNLSRGGPGWEHRRWCSGGGDCLDLFLCLSQPLSHWPLRQWTLFHVNWEDSLVIMRTLVTYRDVEIQRDTERGIIGLNWLPCYIWHKALQAVNLIMMRLINWQGLSYCHWLHIITMSATIYWTPLFKVSLKKMSNMIFTPISREKEWGIGLLIIQEFSGKNENSPKHANLRY